MDRQTLEELIDAAAARYGDTEDPTARDEIEKLSQRLYVKR
jgi:hypothetical protein